MNFFNKLRPGQVPAMPQRHASPGKVHTASQSGRRERPARLLSSQAFNRSTGASPTASRNFSGSSMGSATAICWIWARPAKPPSPFSSSAASRCTPRICWPPGRYFLEEEEQQAKKLPAGGGQVRIDAGSAREEVSRNHFAVSERHIRRRAPVGYSGLSRQRSHGQARGAHYFAGARRRRCLRHVPHAETRSSSIATASWTLRIWN